MLCCCVPRRHPAQRILWNQCCYTRHWLRLKLRSNGAMTHFRDCSVVWYFRASHSAIHSSLQISLTSTLNKVSLAESRKTEKNLKNLSDCNIVLCSMIEQSISTTFLLEWRSKDSNLCAINYHAAMPALCYVNDCSVVMLRRLNIPYCSSSIAFSADFTLYFWDTKHDDVQQRTQFHAQACVSLQVRTQLRNVLVVIPVNWGKNKTTQKQNNFGS